VSADHGGDRLSLHVEDAQRAEALAVEPDRVRAVRARRAERVALLRYPGAELRCDVGSVVHPQSLGRYAVIPNKPEVTA
jgi:hypothetical protein